MKAETEYRQKRTLFIHLLTALFLLCCATGIAAAETTTEAWTLTLTGFEEQTITTDEFQDMKAEHGVTFTDMSGNVYSGVPLTTLIGTVDDADPATFNTTRAAVGYSIIIRATDWHDRIFSPDDLTDTGFCIADSVNDGPLPLQDGDTKIAPLVLVGEDVPPGMGIGNILDITLEGEAITGETKEPVNLMILRYDEDGGEILNATTTDCGWMKEHLPVYGDANTTYNYQGPTFDIDDLWNPTEDKNLEKVWEAPMGTAISDRVRASIGFGRKLGVSRTSFTTTGLR